MLYSRRAPRGERERVRAGQGRGGSQARAWPALEGKLHLTVFKPGTRKVGFSALSLNSFWLMFASWGRGET